MAPAPPPGIDPWPAATSPVPVGTPANPATAVLSSVTLGPPPPAANAASRPFSHGTGHADEPQLFIYSGSSNSCSSPRFALRHDLHNSGKHCMGTSPLQSGPGGRRRRRTGSGKKVADALRSQPAARTALRRSSTCCLSTALSLCRRGTSHLHRMESSRSLMMCTFASRASERREAIRTIAQDLCGRQSLRPCSWFACNSENLLKHAQLYRYVQYLNGGPAPQASRWRHSARRLSAHATSTDDSITPGQCQ